MLEVGWQRVTEPNMARSDETDLFTKENILKTVSNQGYLFIASYQLNYTHAEIWIDLIR